MPQQQMDEEQMKALQEKIKNMSPEELKEFQKKQCIFCHIASGKVQAKRVFEDNQVLAILDINPANPGHIVVFPKEHYSIMPQIPEDEMQHFFMVVKALSNACLKSLDVRGTNIIVANGVAAGQRANHFMAHVIPRKDGDGINFALPQNEIDDAKLDEIALKLGKKVADSLGKKFKAEKSKKGAVKAAPKPVEVSKKEVKDVEKKDVKEEVKKKDEKIKEPKKVEKKGIKKEMKVKKPKKKSSGVNLDDIADILGGKK